MLHHMVTWRCAGRRGYDDAGNVAFVGFTLERVASLACAAVPQARGMLCMTAPCTLRLLAPCVPPGAVGTLLSKPLAAVGPAAAPCSCPIEQAEASITPESSEKEVEGQQQGLQLPSTGAQPNTLPDCS